MHQHVVCTSCHYPLDVSEKIGTRVVCPRCDNWTEVASDCSTSCLSCATRADSQCSSLANSKEDGGILTRFKGLLKTVAAKFSQARRS